MDMMLPKPQKDYVLHHDEILNYLDGRYISATGALWHLNEFFMSEKSYVLFRLAVHLPEKKSVSFQECCKEQEIKEPSSLHQQNIQL